MPRKKQIEEDTLTMMPNANVTVLPNADVSETTAAEDAATINADSDSDTAADEEIVAQTEAVTDEDGHEIRELVQPPESENDSEQPEDFAHMDDPADTPTPVEADSDSSEREAVAVKEQKVKKLKRKPDQEPKEEEEKSDRIYSIDGELGFETESEKRAACIRDVIQAARSRRMLKATLCGVETQGSMLVGVAHYGCLKVIIPASEFAEAYHIPSLSALDNEKRMMNTRLGSEFDFIVTKATSEMLQQNIIIASRVRAMAIKMRKYWHLRKRDESGTLTNAYRLQSGVTVEARVVAVQRAGIIVEVYGVEGFVPVRNLSYQRIGDPTMVFVQGDRIPVKITSIERDENGDVKAEFSVKEVREKPSIETVQSYKLDSVYSGEVSLVAPNGVYVSLGGIDCLCPMPTFNMRPVQGCRVTLRITAQDVKNCRLFGRITYVTPARL